MIDRMCAGLMPAKPHTVLRAPNGEIVYEEMFTRHGFSGAFSYLYHRYPITEAQEARRSARGFSIAKPDPEARHPLRRQLFLSDSIAPGGQLCDARTPVVTNADVTISYARPTESQDIYFANGDGDELWFVQDGEAQLESVCGWLNVKTGDYVFVPRSLVHRWHLRSASMRMLVFECHSGLMIPKDFRNENGQLRMDAPYTHRDFVRPVGPIATFDTEPAGPHQLLVKKDNRFSEYTTTHSPMDVIGWDGFVYPFAFAIDKYQPKTGLVHLPPTIHSTFAGPGFLVCSFVPRVTDYHPQAIPCPYPHSSVECDELILYVKGNFTSRRGVGPGAMSVHPAGIAHGPHPGAYEASIGHTRTDETAVMIDTYRPLIPTEQARAIELDTYHQSWAAKGQARG